LSALLDQLEAESIHILRETAAECERPVMLYSIGKDSAAMLHLARKAFFPAKLPFPLLHVDTTWKFREMIAFRDDTARDLGLELLVHTNPEGLAQGVNPITHGSSVHTDVMKTQALRQALNQHGFDAAIGGARRDEEKSRAKERVFSFRRAGHGWDPKAQRPELWRLYNAPQGGRRKLPGVPTVQLDRARRVALPPAREGPGGAALFRRPAAGGGARRRPDHGGRRAECRCALGEQPQMRTVRFRTLGCTPCPAPSRSRPRTSTASIAELRKPRLRAVRAADRP
jgi:sulfate adenylyltransferase subunit 2